MFKWKSFLPPDKSFLIRAILFSLLTDEEVILKYDSELSLDSVSALEMIKICGKKVIIEREKITIQGCWTKEKPLLNAGNSATAMRLMLGIACHLKRILTISGDESLFSRDHSIFICFMKRFGIETSVTEKTISIESFSEVSPIEEIALPVQSAQLKSFLILALLKTGGILINCGKTRNYTEIILNKMGAEIVSDKKGDIVVKPLAQKLDSYFFSIPKDASSLFIAISAAIAAHRDIVFKDVVVDKTRIEPFNMLKKSGYNIVIQNETISLYNTGELKTEKIICKKEMIPQIIDEIPFLSFLIPLKGNILVLEDISWLKNKESDRVDETVKRISMFFKIRLTGETLTIFPEKSKNIYKELHSKDHRMEMLSAIMALYRNEYFNLNGEEKVSFPHFSTFMQRISAMKKISLKRDQLDKIDDKIMELLEKRFFITDTIQKIKKEENIKITDLSRENAIVTKIEKFYNSDKIKNIYKNIFNNSKSLKKQ